jgi:hypothetical protein
VRNEDRRLAIVPKLSLKALAAKPVWFSRLRHQHNPVLLFDHITGNGARHTYNSDRQDYYGMNAFSCRTEGYLLLPRYLVHDLSFVKT